MSSSITEKIAKILNQAENAGTEEESATFMAKAQELATIHSIDLAKARHATIAKERTVPISKTITLGFQGTRGLNTLVNLFSGIASANDVKINIAHNSTYVIAFGFEEDIEVAEALFASLSVQMAHAATEFRKTNEWKKDEVYRPGGFDNSGRWVSGRHRSVTWLTARLDFQQAFGSRVSRRLCQAKMEAERSAEVAEGLIEDVQPESTGTALVLVEKRAAIEDFYKETSNARGTYRGGRSSNYGRAHEAGSRAGDRAKLSSASNLPGARRAIA